MEPEMKGNNVIKINHETMIEALQEYFNKRLVLQPVVKSIYTFGCSSWSHTTDSSTDAGFMEVKIQDNGSFLEGGK